MRKRSCTIFLLVVLLASVSGASFPVHETRTIGGTKFEFPTDALADGPVLFGLAMGTSRENGEVHQQELLQWQAFLNASGSALRDRPFYHFPIIDAPGFIQGVIRRGIADSYEGTVGADQAAVIFVKNAKKFAEESAIPIDDRASVAVVLPSGRIAGYVKGLPSSESLRELESLIGN